MRISDWSSDVCSSDLVVDAGEHDERGRRLERVGRRQQQRNGERGADARENADEGAKSDADEGPDEIHGRYGDAEALEKSPQGVHGPVRSEERGVGKECVRTCRYRW